MNSNKEVTQAQDKIIFMVRQLKDARQLRELAQHAGELRREGINMTAVPAMSEKSGGSTEANLKPVTLTVPQAAELLNLCTKTVYALTHRRDFPAFRVGTRTLISYEGLKAWAAAQTGLEAAQ